ncbi:catalase-related domain-containing protein, partial [Paracoccus aurantiacus]
RMYWNSLTENEQAHVASAIVFELSKVSLDHIRERMLSHLQVVHPDLGKRVAKGLGMDLPKPVKPFKEPVDLDPSDALSIQKNWNRSLEGRQVAILFDEGSSKSDIEALKKAVESAKGTVFTVAPKVGGLPLDGGTMKADGQLAGSPSVLFDAVALVLTNEAAAKLAKDSAAVAFVSDAFAHLKAIGATEGAKALMDRAGVEPDEGVTDLAGLPEAAKLRYWDREPKVRDLA